ncbi:MAG: hydrogenase 3 maturation endopeptidase HyCI [Candidatus Micrarchaeota archaeon]
MSWREELEKALTGKKVIVLGVGNDMKGDDALGKYVFDRLKTDSKIFCATMPENYIKTIKPIAPDVILIVDAADFGEEPGTIGFVSSEQLQKSSASTHSMSFLLFARMLPDARLYVLGVQPESIEFGEPMSGIVKKRGNEVAAVLNRRLRDPHC